MRGPIEAFPELSRVGADKAFTLAGDLRDPVEARERPSASVLEMELDLGL